LALDLAKAFDSIDPHALVVMLSRFGLPDVVLNIVRNIYSDRRFRVRGDGGLSSERHQRAGISQGCPLSPFLFVMLMTVVMEDAEAKLCEEDKEMHSRGALASFLYADDTLLVGVSTESLQRFLDTVAESGMRCGLKLHWDKFQLIQIRCDGEVQTQDHRSITKKASMSYLGTVINGDGTLQNELNSKLGTAWSDFSKLERLWRHTSLSTKRKLEVFQAVITSRLLNGLSSAWLHVKEQRQIDGFQARCLRRILGVMPSFISRVSNQKVLEQSGQRRYTCQLLRQQLLLYGKIARSPDDDVLRALTFCPGSLQPVADRHVRWVGRPRHEWAGQLNLIALKVAGARKVEDMIKNEAS
jgi:hypothetical protein